MDGDRVPPVDDLDPGRERDADLEPIDARRGADRHRRVDLVLLEGALAVELEPGADVRRGER